jgi:hypothetical protein
MLTVIRGHAELALMREEASEALRADLRPPLLAALEVAPAAPRQPRHRNDHIVPLSPSLSMVTFSAS